MSRSCNQYRKLLTAFVDGEISQPEGRELDIHIGRCASCRRFAESLWKQRSELESALGTLGAGTVPWQAEDEGDETPLAGLVVVQKAEAFVGDRTTFNHAECRAGQRVQTPVGARADVHLPDGSFLHLDSQSHIVLDAMDTKRSVTLQEGNLEADIAPGPAPFVIETPSGEIRMASGKFRVEVSASGVANIEVHAGSLRFVNKFGETPVYREGTVTVMHKEKPPRPSALAPRAGTGDRRASRGLPEPEWSTPRAPKKPKPFVSQYARSRSSASNWMVWLLVLLLAGGGLYFGGRAALDQMEEWGEPAVTPVVWPVSDFVETSEEYTRRERALQMRSLLRYLLWGLTSEDQPSPVNRGLELTDDQTGLEIIETPSNRDRARTYLLSRFGKGTPDLAELEDETLYTVVFPVVKRPVQTVLDWHNREAHVRKVADLLAESLDLTVRDELQPHFPPHVAVPPGGDGRIAVTARGYLLKQVPNLVSRIPWDPLYRDYGELYSPNNAAYEYARLEQEAGAVLANCTQAPAITADPAALLSATPCLEAASPMLNRLREALGMNLDYRVVPVATVLSDAQTARRPLPTPPRELYRPLVVDALARAVEGETAEAQETLFDLAEAASELRRVPGSLEMIRLADDLDAMAARGLEALLNLARDEEVESAIVANLKRQQTSRPPVDIQEAYRLQEYGTTPYAIELAPIAEPVVVLETWASANNGLAGLLAELALHYRDTEAWPASIESATFTASDGFRLDPFTRGRPFGYVSNATGMRVWSVGPDENDQGGEVEYNPSNGVLSAGDIVYRLSAP